MDGYYELGWMIRLARAGLMDTLTIRAFMISFGYCSKEFENSRHEVAEIPIHRLDSIRGIMADIEESAYRDWVPGTKGDQS